MTFPGKTVASADSSEEAAETRAQPTASTRSDSEARRAVDTSSTANVGSAEFEEFCRHVFQFILKKSSRQEAGDLFQEAYLGFLRAVRRAPVRTSKGLFMRIAQRTLFKFYKLKRKNQQRLMPLDLLDPQDERLVQVEATEFHDLKRDFNAALSKLPPTHRDVLLLVGHEQKSRKETATELNLSPDTVKKYSTQARAMMRQLLERVPSPTTVPSGDKKR